MEKDPKETETQSETDEARRILHELANHVHAGAILSTLFGQMTVHENKEGSLMNETKHEILEFQPRE